MPIELLIFPPLAVAVLIVLVWRGLLSRRALRGSPRRHVGFGGLELAMGALIFLFCIAVLAPLGFGALNLTVQPGQAVSPAHHVRAALAGQVFMQLPLVIFTLVLAGRHPHGLRELGIVPRHPVRDISMGAVGLGAALALVFGLNTLVILLAESWFQVPRPDVGHELIRVFQNLDSLGAKLGMVLTAVVLAPVLEEIIFRGWLQTCLLGLFGRQRRWLIVITGSLIFTSVHGVPWQVMPGLFVLSLVIGWLYERTGSLWPCITLHAGFNGFNLLMALMVQTAGP